MYEVELLMLKPFFPFGMQLILASTELHSEHISNNIEHISNRFPNEKFVKIKKFVASLKYSRTSPVLYNSVHLLLLYLDMLTKMKIN